MAGELGGTIRYRTICWSQIVLLGISTAISPSATAAELKPEAARGYARYLQLTEQRMNAELAPADGFLWVDSLPERQRLETYARLEHGEVVTTRIRTPDPSGSARTPEAMIHHWVGTAFIPAAALRQVLTVLQDYDHHNLYYKPEVVKSSVIARSGGDYRIHYRLRWKKMITVVLDTDYDVHYHDLDASHAFIDSHAVRIAEVEHAGDPAESQLPPGKDGGFLWRLDTYWRLAETAHGVYVQCEAVSLTRDIPTGLHWLLEPLVENIPKAALEFTLQSTRTAVEHANPAAPR